MSVTSAAHTDVTCDQISENLHPQRVTLPVVSNMPKVSPGEDQEDQQDAGGGVFPGKSPVKSGHFRQIDIHLRHVVKEGVHAVDPAHENNLQKGEQEEVPGWGGGIEESEHVNTAIAGEGETQHQHGR